MSPRQLKTGYFILEGLNGFATAYYFFYLFFFMENQFHFTKNNNLWLAALNGFVYMLLAAPGGAFAQKFGCFRALKLGFATMTLALTAALALQTPFGQILTMVLWTCGICFTWPTLEALASERESPTGLQQMIGIYNLVWAGTAALAYFSGGAMLDNLGLQSIFWLPISIHIIQLTLLLWLEQQHRHATLSPASATPTAPTGTVPPLNPRPIAKTNAFLRMAWLANPFAYMAINTIVAAIPALAKNFQLTPTLAGFFCSVWFFARLAAFLILWLWPGWHYRFRWLAAAYLCLLAGFATILLGNTLSTILIAQIAFGLGLGLIYYSSLYYSMDVGKTKGQHGGFHEAAIGIGLFAGPALGAATLTLQPGKPDSGTWTVSTLLAAGFVSILMIGFRNRHLL